MKVAAGIIAILMTAGCTDPTQPLEFLTREGCVQTKIMRLHLDQAIAATGKQIQYTVVDLDALASNDSRRGYPTPTILRGGVDVFGMAAPTPPFPDPT